MNPLVVAMTAVTAGARSGAGLDSATLHVVVTSALVTTAVLGSLTALFLVAAVRRSRSQR